MEPKKKLNLFLKILIAVFGLIVVSTVVGRNHFLFGTTLIMFRWIFLVLGLYFLFLTFKRSSHKIFKFGLIAVVLLVAAEYGWNRYQEGKLKSSATSIEVTLMTYNIFFRNFSLDVTVSNIKKIDPDILAVQELTPSLKSKLESTLNSKYHYRETLALGGTHGIGIYSKHPIRSSKFLMNPHNHPFAQIVEIQVGHKLIQVFNVHLASPATAVENPDSFWQLYSSNYDQRTDQLKQIQNVMKFNENKYTAQLMLGDLNTTSYEPIYRNIRNEWVNLYDLAGNGFGFNFPNSTKMPTVLTLDYMFGRGSVNVIEMNVIEGGGSDHLAVAGKVRL